MMATLKKKAWQEATGQHKADGYDLSMWRHDPVASPQDGTPTKQASDKTRPRNRCGSLWARIHRQDNETPALNALKALRGAPISMGRGEIPVELRPAAVRFLPLLWF